ncbi:hypothetical protein BDZ91DRAFT_767881 [Kalaharituber pfeilii]|nr:hypothetical protein BDZ91DRAFT_767881 [Kalaharituber pfeilii]
MNVTGDNARGILLPPSKENGWTPGYMGNMTNLQGENSTSEDIQMGAALHDGFPDTLYPNPADSNLDDIVDKGGLVMGPLQVNDSFFMMSFTNPIINNTAKGDVLGFITVVVNAQLVFDVVRDTRGLGDTGQVILVGPGTSNNLYSSSDTELVKSEGAHPWNTTLDTSKMSFQYLFPPKLTPTLGGKTKTWDQFPAVKKAYLEGFQLPFPKVPKPFDQLGFSMLEAGNDRVRSAGRMERTVNAQGTKVSAGYVMPSFDLVNWVLICEQTQAEVFGPIGKLRNIMLATVFGTCFIVVLVVCPIAHFAVRPIARLKEATSKTTQPPSYYRGSSDSERDNMSINSLPPDNLERGFKLLNFNLRKRFPKKQEQVDRHSSHESRRRIFRIPGRVELSRVWIEDELTDLTNTYNAMTDELARQYEHLEERVAERTKELEEQKKLAEAANEAKGLFVANISHELRTPLNGILGMAAVCMGEQDLTKIKESLSVVYRSGELLHNLLTDLLNFSKNQFGGHLLTLDEGQFRMLEIVTQINSIFGQQAKDSHIDFSILLEPEEEVMDMVLWGDSNRILQVLINLVGNSLKFTPENGLVQLRITLKEEVEQPVPIASSTDLDRYRKPKSSSKTGSGASIRPSVNSKLQSKEANSNPNSKAPSPMLLPQNPGNGLQASLSETHSDNADKYEAASSDTEDLEPPPDAKSFWFEFAVEDTGPGIPEHLQQRVFEPFVQGDLRLSKRYGGTGLGLSICAQLTKLMHGTIHLRSLEQTGSTFTVLLPLKFVKSGAASMEASEFSGMLLPISKHPFPATPPPPPPLPPPQPPVDPSQDNWNETKSLRSNASVRSLGSKSVGATLPRNSMCYGRGNKPTLNGLPSNYYLQGSSSHATPRSEASDLFHSPAGETIYSAASGETNTTAAVTPPVEERPLSALKVLVAEDNMVNQEVVSRMLKLENVQDISFAKDGQEAVDCVKSALEQNKTFDLVFMDIQMPNVDGLEATRIIRQLGYNAPIVALTAFSEESNMKECREAGMNFFLAKPIKRNELRKVLKQYCRPPKENLDRDRSGAATTEDKFQVYGKSPTKVATTPAKANRPRSKSAASVLSNGWKPILEAERKRDESLTRNDTVHRRVESADNSPPKYFLARPASGQRGQ